VHDFGVEIAMKLSDLCEAFSELGFPRRGEEIHPDRASVLRLRTLVRDELVHGELLTDCITHELSVIELGSRRGRTLVPFFVDPDFGVRFAFGYWPPGLRGWAHEHTAWSISAVCHNRLNVSTYDRAESYRRRELVPKNLFEATTLEVGYIYEPAIHSPWNPSNDWSLSLHISSPRDGEAVDDLQPFAGLRTAAQARERPSQNTHPYDRVLQARLGRQEADLLARVLQSSSAPEARELLVTCSRFTSPAMRAALRSEMPERPGESGACAASRVLARVHPDLRFALRGDPLQWTVVVETPWGPRDVICVSDLALDAVVYASTSMGFDVRDLPGDLSDEQRAAIADTLEDVGLFKGMAV